jgi:hypothetical protein
VVVLDRSLVKVATRLVVLNNHIAYSILAILTTKIFGMAEWAVRLPALLLGAGFAAISVRERSKRATVTQSQSRYTWSLVPLWKSFLIAAIVITGLYLPVATELRRTATQRGRAEFMPDFPRQVLEAFASTGSTLLVIGLCMLSALGALRLARQWPAAACYLMAVLMVPLVVMWTLARPFDRYPRFFVYWLPVFCLFLAIAFVGLCAWCLRGSAPGRVAKPRWEPP